MIDTKESSTVCNWKIDVPFFVENHIRSITAMLPGRLCMARFIIASGSDEANRDPGSDTDSAVSSGQKKTRGQFLLNNVAAVEKTDSNQSVCILHRKSTGSRLANSLFLIFALAVTQPGVAAAPAANPTLALSETTSPDQIDSLIGELHAPETRSKAVKQLIAAGPVAVPKLIEAYGATKEPFIQLTIGTIIKEIGAPAAEPLIAAWDSGNSDAANLLLILGRDAKAALPLAMRELNHKEADHAVLAAMVLGGIGPDASPAVPGLLNRLKGDESWLSTQSANAMTNIGRPSIDPAIEPLIEMVRKRERNWDKAARVLGSGRAEPKVVVPLIVAAFRAETNDGAAFSVMLGLRDYGQAAGPAIPVLKQYASRETNDDPASMYAAEAIANVYPEGVIVLRDLLKYQSDAVRQRSIRALDRSRHRAMAALPELIANAGHANPEIRSAAAHTIGRMGYAGARGVPKLTQLLVDPDDEVKRSAASALGDLGPWAAPAVPALRRMIGEPNRVPHLAAIRAVGRIGPQAAAAVPDLIAILDRREQSTPDDPQFAHEEMRDVLNALGQMQEQAAPASARLAEIVRLDVKDHSDSAAAALKWIGPRAAETSSEVIPALVGAIERKQSLLAAGALFRMGPKARAAVPVLLQMLKSAEADRSYIAAAALMAAAPAGDPQVLAELDALQTHPQAHVRMARIVAAAKLRGDTRAAVGAAVAHLADTSLSPADRRYAVGLLSYFGSKARPAVPTLIGICQQGSADLNSFMLIFESQDLLFEMALIDPDASKAVEKMIVSGNFQASEWAARKRHFKK